MSIPTEDEIESLIAPYGVDENGNPYQAHETQRKIRAWVEGVTMGLTAAQGVPVLYVQHGVNSGGTRGILAPVLELMFQLPGMRVLIGRQDFNDLRLSVMNTFVDVVPKNLITARDHAEHRMDLQGPHGISHAYFRNLKDVKGLGSQEFSVITVHEAHEIAESSYRTLKQRCRQRGYPCMILMEGNPPSEGHWLDDIIKVDSPNYDPDLTRFVLPSTENWEYMSESYKNMINSQPPAWRKRFMLGLVGSLPSGKPVYPAFVESTHVQETQIIPDRPVLRFWDFGLRRAGCIWAQKEDNGRLLIHREWLAIETPEERFIDGVIERTNDFFGPVICKDFGDPAARNRDPHGVSTLTRLKNKKIHLNFRNTTYGQRIPLVNRKLSELISGTPAVVFNPFCRILIEGMMGGWHYPELKEGQAFSAKKDEPFKDGWFEHLCNAFEYGMIGLFMGAQTDMNQKQRSLHRERMRRWRDSAPSATTVY